jgi:hypothetical protein
LSTLEAIRETTESGGSALPSFVQALAAYDPIGLAQMDGVALLKRTDTKYVLAESSVLDVLACLSDTYRVLDIDGLRLQNYRTQYFDTENLSLYLRHHAGNAVRYKVRSRAYVDTGVAFLEVKKKNNKEWTTKSRTRTDDLLLDLSQDAETFVAVHLPLTPQPLHPVLWNEFVRITLVNKRYPERLTFDLDLRFGRDGSSVELPGIAVCEVKQNGINRYSDFFREMRARSLHPNGISKYCIGVSLLYDAVKHNNFKPKLRLIEKLRGGTFDAGRCS